MMASGYYFVARSLNLVHAHTINLTIKTIIIDIAQIGHGITKS
jgi:hypothetical protein